MKRVSAGAPSWRRTAVRAAVASVVVAGGVVFAATPSGAIASRTVAFWSMDEAPGSTVLVDSSGNGRNGTIGSDVTAGTVYDGATGHRFATHLPSDAQAYPGHVDRIPHHASLNPEAGDFSVTVRLRTTYSFGNVLQKGQGSNPGGYWKLESPGGTPRCLFRGSDGSSRTGYTDTPVTDGRWHTIRCNRTSTFVEMYVDGVRTSRLTGPTGTISNTAEVSVGGKGTCDGVQVTCDYFVGDIDYVRIEKGSDGGTNAPPVAKADADCTGLVCTLDGSGSTDSDGAIQKYVWDFGDGVVVDGFSVPGTVHTYAAAGSYPVQLTVTDDRGATSTVTTTVTVAPVPEVISFVGSSTADANAVTHQVTVPAAVQEGDALLLFLSQNTQATTSGPTGTGWTPVDSLAGGSARTTVWRRTATAGTAGTSVAVTLSAQSKANLVLAAYRGVDPAAPIAAYARATDTASSAVRTTPAVTVAVDRAWGVSYWMHGDSASTQLTPPSGVAVRSNSSQTGGGRVTGLLADSAASLPQGSYGHLAATAAAASTTTTTWTLVLRPDLGPPPPDQAPTAVADATCDGLTCTVTGDGSTDADGTITAYGWDFGDGTPPVTGPGATARHTYAAAGTYRVTLTVTDDDGVTASATTQVTVAPVADLIAFVGQSTSNAYLATHSTTVPAGVQAGDALLLFFSEASPTTIGAPDGVTGWNLLDTVDGGNTRTRVWSKVAAAGDSGAQVRLTLPSQVKANLVIAAYRGTDQVAPVAAVARAGTTASSAARVTPVAGVSSSGSWAVSYWAHRDSSTTTMTPPAEVTVRTNGSQTGGGRVTGLLADSGAAVPVGSYGGLTATAAAASSSATTWTVVLARG